MKNYIAKRGGALLALLMTAVLALSFAGCKKASEKMDEAVYGGLDKVQNLSESEYGSAQEIVDLYSAKMEQQAKALGKELKKEAPARYRQDGTLAVLLKEKTGYVDALYDAYTKATSILMDDYQEALKTVQ